MSLTGQLAIEFEPGITQRYGSLLECIASGVYQRNLKSIASDLDLPRGNLTVMLSGDGQRHFGVDHLERYIEATGDVTPILYLVAKHLGGAAAKQESAVAQAAATLSMMSDTIASLTQQLAQAGAIDTKAPKRRK